jgi:hypothetical protein
MWRELMLTKAVASSVLAFTVAVVAIIQSSGLVAPSAEFLMKPALEPASLLLCGSGLILFARRIRPRAVDQNR